jgi:hypothetical protein
MAEADDDLAPATLELQTKFKTAREHASKWREQAKECFEFYSGRQWSETDLEKLRSENRPAIVFNRAAVLIDAVLGYETNNRLETRYIPRTLGDAKVNEILTGAADYFRDQCDAEYHESDAFRDSMIAGMGWTGDRLSDEANPEYDLIRERVDPFEMLWDPSARMPNLADARYLFRKKKFAYEEVRGMFPKWDGELGDTSWIGEDDDWDDPETKDSNPRQDYKNDEQSTSPNREIPVIEHQYMDRETIYIVSNGGETIELSSEQFEDNKEKIEKAELKYATKNKTTYKRCFLIGGQIVKEDTVCPMGFTYHCITGKRDRNKGYWIGIMSALIDPQRWSNKWLSQILNILNNTAKPGWDVEESAVKNVQKFRTEAAKPGAVLVFNDGALQHGRAQYRTPAAMPTGHERLLEYANDAFTAVSGVNQEIMGLADREQPGVLEYQRKQSAVTLLAPLFDSLRRYRKMAGRTWLYLMTHYMSDGRMVRITQDEQEQNSAFGVQPGMDPQQAQMQGGPAAVDWKSKDVTDYDVIIDQAASAPNQKEATWAVMNTLLPVIQEILPPQVMMTLLEYSPLPESLVTKIKQQVANMPPPPNPEQEKLEIEKQKMGMQMQLKQAELQIKQQSAQQDMQLEVEKAKIMAQIEREKATQQMQLEREKAQNQIQIEAMKARSQIELQQFQGAQAMQLERQRFGFEAEQTEQEMDLSRRQGEQQLTQKAALADQQIKAAKNKAKMKPRPNGDR